MEGLKSLKSLPRWKNETIFFILTTALGKMEAAFSIFNHLQYLAGIGKSCKSMVISDYKDQYICSNADPFLSGASFLQEHTFVDQQ